MSQETLKYKSNYVRPPRSACALPLGELVTSFDKSCLRPHIDLSTVSPPHCGKAPKCMFIHFDGSNQRGKKQD